jgi:cell division control protein 11
MEDVEHYGIPVYNFPYDVEEDDEETVADNSELRVGSLPGKTVNLTEALSGSGSTTLCYCR